jgi:hypothetical protein
VLSALTPFKVNKSGSPGRAPTKVIFGSTWVFSTLFIIIARRISGSTKQIYIKSIELVVFILK